MGSQQLFCLRWSNHQSNMLSVFDQLLQSEALVDVTLACEGLSLRAHKVVLSACSPYFQSLFIENPCKHPIVILKDIKFTDMKALVDFMYKGEVNVTQEQLSALLKTAETLKVKGLAEMTGGASSSSSASNAHPPPNSCAVPPLVPPPPLPLALSGSAAVAIPPHPALKQIPPRSASPPSKRKKIRPRRSSRENSPHSDMDDNDSIDIHGSPEVIEAKFEVSSEAFGPERPADQDSHPDTISDLQGDPTSRESHEDSTPAGYVNSAPRMNNTNPNAPHSAPATPPIPLLPPPPQQQQQPPPPTLPASLPSTSGTQSASQDLPIMLFANVASMQDKEGTIRDEYINSASTSNGSTVPMVRVGPNTMVDASRYACIDWSSGKRATKHLLQAVFGRHVLATHSLSGKPSNAFCYKQPKPQLDPEKVADITRLKPLEYVMNDPYWVSKPAPKLAITLARKCIFGDEVMRHSNITARNNMQPLDPEKLELIRKQSPSQQDPIKQEDSPNCTPPPFHPRGLPGGSSFLDALHSGAFRGRFTTPPGLPLNNPISPSIYHKMEPMSPSSSSGSSHPKRGQPRILNEEEEKMIVRYIMEMAERGKPVTRKCVLEYGNMLLRRQDRVPTGSIHCNPEKGLSNDWWKEFKKRHPGLPFRLSVPPSS